MVQLPRLRERLLPLPANKITHLSRCVKYFLKVFKIFLGAVQRRKRPSETEVFVSEGSFFPVRNID
jgi:hypothetical protein